MNIIYYNGAIGLKEDFSTIQNRVLLGFKDYPHNGGLKNDKVLEQIANLRKEYVG